MLPEPTCKNCLRGHNCGTYRATIAQNDSKNVLLNVSNKQENNGR